MAVFVAVTYVTVPVTDAPPEVATATANVPGATIEAELIDMLNVAVIFWLIGTLVAEFRGTVEITVGIAPVVNVHT